jgi:hypothetical protein
MKPEDSSLESFAPARASAEIRQKVADCVHCFCNGDPADLANQLPILLDLMHEEDIIPELLPLLDSEYSPQRLYVAAILRAAALECPNQLRPPVVDRCARILVDSLMHESPTIRNLGIGLLAQQELPEGAAPLLRKQFKSGDTDAMLLSSMALSRSSDPEPEAVRFLTKVLTSEDSDLAGVAAIGLLRISIQDRAAIDAIKRSFGSLGLPIVRQLFLTAYEVGAPAGGLFDIIAQHLADASQDDSLRMWCAAALGSITRGTDHATSLLLDALQSPISLVVEGAALGLAASKNVPAAACSLLAPRLRDPDVAMRRSAAIAAASLSAHSLALIPALVERLAEETDGGALSEITAGLSAIGKPGLPALIEMVDLSNEQVEEQAGMVLVSFGEDAAEIIGKNMMQCGTVEKFNWFLRVLYSLGSKAAPAVPALIDNFGIFDNETVLLNIIRIFFACGPGAVDAVPVLVDFFAVGNYLDNDLDFWVKQTLSLHPLESSHALRQQLALAVGPARTRLETLLSILAPTLNKQPGRLSGFAKLGVVKRFVLIASALEGHGPCSMRSLGIFVRSKASEKGSGQTGVSDPNISRTLAQLEEWTQEALTTRRDKGEVSLSAEGRLLLEECKTLLYSDHRRKNS